MKSIFLLAVFILITPVSATAFCTEDEEPITLNIDSARSIASGVISTFLHADNNKRYKLTSEAYRNIFNSNRYVREEFSKESYRVISLERVSPYRLNKRDAPAIYTVARIAWQFEGYQGDQICHFRLVNERGNWKIDWFLC